MKMSTETKELFSALSKAQADIRGAVKDSTNPFFQSRYADLESVWEACRVALTKNGLSVTQSTDFTPDAGTCVVTVLGHSSGQWISGLLPIMAVKPDPQGMGSAITYARRYALAAIVGVVQVDDDGESAVGRGNGVAPGTPGPNDGNKDPLKYKIDFGKWSQRTLEEVLVNHGPQEMASYISYLEEQAIKQNKPIQGKVKRFIEEASAFLGAFENAPLGPGSNG